jgi:hypothetical protein
MCCAKQSSREDASVGNGRLVGTILIVVGVVAAVLIGAFLLTEVNAERLTSSGAILGAGIGLLVLVAPLIGFGLVMMRQGQQDAVRQARATQQRELLDIVRSRGQVNVSDLALEMQLSQDDIRAIVHKLVGLQVFSGYINWDKGVLYSGEASQLRTLEKCENCGGEIELTGKGVVTCRFCGTEYFLS